MGSKTLVEAVDNLAGIETGTDSGGSTLPANFDSLKVIKSVDATTGFPASLRKTNGTVTMVGDVPTVTPGTETVAYVATILTYANGQVASQGDWVNQYA